MGKIEYGELMQDDVVRRWDHDVPPRYELDDIYSEEGGFWGLCADVEGLFVDPPPAQRERCVLLGCAPAGILREALAIGAPTQVGHLLLKLDFPQMWDLLDVTVLGHSANAEDPARLDISIECSFDDLNGPDEIAPITAGFEVKDRDEVISTCRDTAGIFVYRPAPAEVPLRLLGCAPEGKLLDFLDFGQQVEVGPIALTALNRDGRATAYWCLQMDVIDWRPSSFGSGLLDITVRDGVFDPPPPAIRPMWDLWFDGGPTELNSWAELDSGTRSQWSLAALDNHRPKPDVGPGHTFHLDGRHVTDISGFFCALGEAINGPGGYFGSNFHGLDDCLGGGWGAAMPCTLVWHDSRIALEHLRTEADGLIRSDDAFGYIEAFLLQAGLDVVLA